MTTRALLAPNATIGNARSGESDKGFGVVANEAKELAPETADPTEDIPRRVQVIGGDTTAAALTASRTAVDELSRMSADLRSTVSRSTY